NDYALDMQLVKYDCIASIAHARMLGRIGILNKKEVKMLVSELNSIIVLWENGDFKISKEQEDMHTAIENRLTEKLGGPGKKIHTGRSRNDQVLTALRLYYKDSLKECISLSEQLITSMKAFSSKYGEIALPGYTHTRKAMPSSVGLWTGAFIDSMKDNIKLLNGVFEIVDQSPLGTAAGYGSPITLDREFTARELGFARVQENPIYVQMSRGKFEASILHAISQIMLDFNKIASDLIVFSMPELGYYELPVNFTTGSSMMPNKKNPDILERMRANYHVMMAYESEVKGISGNLMTGYNGDIQLTKEPMLNGFSLAKRSIRIGSLLFMNLRVNRKNCKRGLTEDVYATHSEYNLVHQGMPFRDAYTQVGRKYSGKE
ncbi:MAG: argininosuccinate lyase, partial [Candidatus Marsarchaeota archaeon]|nr:argininosuccinate lyase [Candidatus Marsarchaeota archaeon]